MSYKQHLENTRNYIQNYFENNQIGRLSYHNLIHTESVVSHAWVRLKESAAAAAAKSARGLA